MIGRETTNQILRIRCLLDQCFHLIWNLYHRASQLFHLAPKLLSYRRQILFGRCSYVFVSLGSSLKEPKMSRGILIRPAVMLTGRDHSTSGSCAKASRTLMSASVLVRRMLSAISAALRKTPTLSARSSREGLTLDSRYAQSIHQIVGQSEWYFFRNIKCFPLQPVSRGCSRYIPSRRGS